MSPDLYGQGCGYLGTLFNIQRQALDLFRSEQSRGRHLADGVRPSCQLVWSQSDFRLDSVIFIRSVLAACYYLTEKRDVLQKRSCRGAKQNLFCIGHSALQPEGLADEQNLPNYIGFRQPSHLALPDHMHNLVTLYRSPSSIERPKSLAGIYPPFDRSMILFHNIIQVRTGSTATPAPQLSLLLQFRDHLWIRGVAIYCDDSGPLMIRSVQCLLKESLGRGGITLSGEPEVDRGAGGIHGAIQVSPVPTLANVRLVDPPRAVGWLQFPTTPPVEFGSVSLHPAPNGRMISR
jgi:hypothetical protein